MKKRCSDCKGKKKIALFTSVVECETCEGTGKVEDEDYEPKRPMSASISLISIGRIFSHEVATHSGASVDLLWRCPLEVAAGTQGRAQGWLLGDDV